MAVTDAVKAAEAATPRRAAPPILRVSTLELFFDLVFVFAITQLAHLPPSCWASRSPPRSGGHTSTRTMRARSTR